MILYSIIPVEIVFGNYLKTDEQDKYFEIEYMGEKVIVSASGNNEYTISKLLSTSPQAFLNPKLQPGSIISGGDLVNIKEKNKRV